MADDLGTLYTDKKVQTLERKLHKEYTQAKKDIEKKTQDFFEKAAKKEKVMLQKLSDGKITQDEFDHWKSGKVFAGENWKAQQESIAKVLSDTNSVATAMINGEKPDVFAFAGNYTAYQFEHGFGVNFGFDLYNVDAVTRLVKDNPKILPKEFLKKAKDERWNMRNVRSQITQGIIQGESIPKIAKRLSEAVPARNEKQMVLHARTAMTSAHNGGKMQRFKEAEDLGIKFKKVWLATLDSRTRDTHQSLDGQAVKPDEPFEVAGMEIMYPGDPDADPSLTFNCRCTMVTELDDYPKEFARRAYNEYYDDDGEFHRESYITEDTTYREWEEMKAGGNIPRMVSQEIKPEDPLAPDKNGIMKGVKKTDKTTPVRIIRDVNTRFDEGRKYRQNCANCVVASEARARGYDVIAKERDYSKNSHIYQFWYDDKPGRGSWTDSFDGMANETINARTKKGVANAIKKKMEEYGDGSRAIIFVKWDGKEVGHYFNVTNYDGEIQFFDSQNGTIGARVEEYFLRAQPSKTRLWRTDDKPLTEFIRKVVDVNE